MKQRSDFKNSIDWYWYLEKEAPKLEAENERLRAIISACPTCQKIAWCGSTKVDSTILEALFKRDVD